MSESITLQVPHEHVPTVCRILINEHNVSDVPTALVYNSQLSELDPESSDPERSELRIYGMPKNSPYLRFIVALSDDDYRTDYLWTWMRAATWVELDSDAAVDLWYEFNPSPWSDKPGERRRMQARKNIEDIARQHVEGWAEAGLAEVGA